VIAYCSEYNKAINGLNTISRSGLAYIGMFTDTIEFSKGGTQMQGKNCGNKFVTIIY
jgi:hypothetical protein